MTKGLTFILVTRNDSHRGSNRGRWRSIENLIKVSSKFELTLLLNFLLFNQPIDQLVFSVLNLLIIEFFPYFIYHGIPDTLQMLYCSFKTIISDVLNLDVNALRNQHTSLLWFRTYSTCDINRVTNKRKLWFVIPNHPCYGSTLI